MSKFREASRESLLLTGTPSVRTSKILNANIVCAGNPSHCKTVASFDNILCIRAPVLELPPLCLDLLNTALCHSSIKQRVQRIFS